MHRTNRVSLAFLVVTLVGGAAPGEGPVPLEKGVRGAGDEGDGQGRDRRQARRVGRGLLHPGQLRPRDLENRAAQFFYMWDDEAFYIGLRCLDRKQANPAPLAATYNGDAVEFYLDTRPGDALRGKDWTAGAIHFFFSPSRARRSSRAG